MNNESFLGLLAESPFAGLQEHMKAGDEAVTKLGDFLTAISCLLYTSPSPRDRSLSRMPSSA